MILLLKHNRADTRVCPTLPLGVALGHEKYLSLTPFARPPLAQRKNASPGTKRKKRRGKLSLVTLAFVEHT
jgi:hypothetical protein